MASPFSFGAAPAAPPASPFGFSTANAAAAPAGSAPAFGAAASAPAFGAAASTPGGFSFGQTTTAPAAASTPAFGTFGAAKPATAPFGASAPAFGASSAPAFGASSTGAFSFSTAPATSSPGLFGATSAPAFGAASSAPSLFGASSAAAAPFGSAPATGGLFGAPAASAAAGVFGLQAPQQQQQQQANVFGGTGQLPGLVDSVSGLSGDDALRALTRLAAAYTPSAPDYRFATLLTSVVERPEQRVKPPGWTDENRWRAALAAIGKQQQGAAAAAAAGGVGAAAAAHAQKLWPVAAHGFRDLSTRSRVQAEAVAENANRLRELQDRAAAMSRRASVEFRSRISALQRQHTALSHQLLHVLRAVDAMESRLALSAGYNAHQARQQVAELGRQLAAAEEAVAGAAAVAGPGAGAGAGLQRRLEAVAAAARMRLGGAAGSTLSSVKLDERSQGQLYAVLQDHAEAVRQLQSVLKADELDVEVLRRLTANGGQGQGAMELGVV